MQSLDRRSLLAALTAGLPLPAIAADPWLKPSSSWSEKDIQKVLADSPWAKSVSISMGSPSMGGGGGRGGRGGRGGGMGGAIPDASSSSGMGGESMGGGGGGAGGGGGLGGGGAAPSLTFLIRWQSAKPVKVATVRARLGAEADSSPQAKQFVEREESEYVIAVIMPPMLLPGEQRRPGSRPSGEGAAAQAPKEGAAERLKQSTWLVWKGHDQLHPVSVTLPQPGQSQNVLVFHFPKSHPIELEDSKVEFCMHRGPMEVKKKFKLKDMVYEGKLTL